jgi:hypothetical protein
MPNAIDTFRAQREAADAVHERLQEIAGLLAQLRREVDLVAGNAALREVLQREQSWLAETQRAVAEVSAWREREARQFWPSVARRWALALVFALVAAWIAGAGYAYIVKPYEDELRVLRAHAAFVESIEDRVITMTPAERRKFDELFPRHAARR